MLMKESFTLGDVLGDGFRQFFSNPFTLIMAFIIIGSIFAFYLSSYSDKLRSFLMRKVYTDGYRKSLYNLHQLRTPREQLLVKSLIVLGAILFLSVPPYILLIFPLLETLIDNLNLGLLFLGLLFIALILYLIPPLSPLMHYFMKIEKRCNDRRDRIVIDAITNRLLEDKEQLGSDEYRKIGISLLEFNKLKEQYRLDNPMSYIKKAIQKT